MKWSWKIARIAGIDLYIHSTFLLLIGFVGVSYWLNDHSLAAVVQGIAFLIALFACVLLHELGHSLMARKYGIPTRDITLLPIGGVARIEKMPDDPMHELWVALAGPAVNLLIALGLFIGLSIAQVELPITDLSLTDGNIYQKLLAVNVSLVLFNLIPAFPMDGGRVVRALLAMRIEYTRATQIAATLGQGIALIFGFVGLFTNPMMVFIALFVWIGAAQEASMVQMKSALSNIPVKRAMLTDFKVLAPTDPLSVSVQYILSGSQRDFPVVADGSVVGILTRDSVIKALTEQNESIFVSHVMQKKFTVIDSSQMLEGISTQLQESKQSIFPVIHDGTLVGLLTIENLGELLMIENAIRSRKISQSIS